MHQAAVLGEIIVCRDRRQADATHHALARQFDGISLR
jgi:hypothetical protein